MKKHFKPEFTVIRQNEANAKFLVASGEFTNSPATMDPTTSDAKAASQYDAGDALNM